jgi:hypothetical protein
MRLQWQELSDPVMHTLMNVCIHIILYIHAFLSVYVYICLYICIFICLYACVSTYALQFSTFRTFVSIAKTEWLVYITAVEGY